MARNKKPKPPTPPTFTLPTVAVSPDEDKPDAPCGEDGLTVRHRAFVVALTTPGGCFGVATRAAAAAGYRTDNLVSLRVTACRLMTNPNIRAAIRVALAALRDLPEFRRNLLVTRASVTMEDFLKLGDDGKPEVDWEAAAAAGALGSVKRYKEDIGLDGSVVGRSLEVYDSTDALKLLFQLDGKINPDPGGAIPTGAAITVNVQLLGDD